MPIGQHYLISVEDMSDPERAADVLNEALQRIADRLDALQGIRGTAEIQGELEVLDADGNVVAGFKRS